MGILYKLTFANGKKYIGITESEYLSRRIGQHRYQAKKENKLPIYLAWRKYGEPEVEIVQRLYGYALYEAEIKTIESLDTICPNGYNLLKGGQASPALNPDVAEKIRQASIIRYQDKNQRIAASIIAKNRSEESKLKISKSLTGKQLSEVTKEKIRSANIGKKHSEETKEKMSISHKGKKYSEETLERMRQAAKKRMQSQNAKDQLKAASLAGGNAMKLNAKR